MYGFVSKGDKTELTIIRLEGPPKEDKFVIQWAEVPDEEDDPQAPFKAGAQAGEVILPIKAEWFVQMSLGFPYQYIFIDKIYIMSNFTCFFYPSMIGMIDYNAKTFKLNELKFSLNGRKWREFKQIR